MSDEQSAQNNDSSARAGVPNNTSARSHVVGSVQGLMPPTDRPTEIDPQTLAQLKQAFSTILNGPSKASTQSDQAGCSSAIAGDERRGSSSEERREPVEDRVQHQSAGGAQATNRARSMSPSALERLLSRLSSPKRKKRSRSSSGSASERSSDKKRRSRHKSRHRHGKRSRRHRHSSSSSSSSASGSGTGTSSDSSRKSSRHRHGRKSHKGLPVPETNYQVNKQQLKFNSSLSKKLKKLKDRCTDRKEKDMVSECLTDVKRRQSEVFVADNFGLRVAKQFKGNQGLLGKKETSKLQQLVLLDSITGNKAQNLSAQGPSGIRFRGRGAGGPRGSNNRQGSDRGRAQRGNYEKREPMPWDECDTCGEMGHWKSGCPNTQPPQLGSRRYPHYGGGNYSGGQKYGGSNYRPGGHRYPGRR